MQKFDGEEIFPIIVDTHSYLKSVNFYLVKTVNALTLVDAGLDTDECWNTLMKTLHDNDFSLQDVTDIVLTHNHVDHVGLINRITASHPIPVYAHQDAIPRLKRDREFFEMRVVFFANLYEKMGCGDAGKNQVNYLKQMMEKNSTNKIHTEITPIGEKHLGFDIIHVPGHASDQIGLYSEINNILFSGDLLINHISSNAFVEPNIKGERLPTLLQHRKSLEKVLTLSPKLVYSGHGILIEEVHSLIKKRITDMERKAVKIKDLIEKGISTGNELAQFYYKKLYSTQFSLVMSEIIGQLDYLEYNRQITKELREDGVWHYFV
ncbi:MBL fold metallo-hydrolase [Oceanobacillus bengalensis]|uniref:MBL fold metallo-hydrolase n=1 Tax=Oceanobacillus bengalensis TaxID=1435466 RepID=A0A494YRC1_9BACI|nr:MBL fold metallo-hydrolase [Oceanobacillus bengalensis]RKQ11643.1 MBL fold metallo-hydrolase [Oceanobacillus bengalensis]